MNKKQKRNLLRILIAAPLFGVGFLPILPELAQAAFWVAAWLVVGYDVVWKALRNILRGQVFDENFLMAVASIGAMILGEYAEGAAVMIFYQVGEWFEKYAVGKARRSISELMDIRPDSANVLRDGVERKVSPEEVSVGEVILVKPGERVPLDGVVMEGSSTMDTSALTGEPAPRDVYVGSEVISGCINQSGLLTVRVEKVYGESTVAKILELVEHSAGKKSKSEAFITKFARWYTPAVVISAVLLAVLPPLIFGQTFSIWIHRALTFLVISCPCALVISVPLSFFGGIGGASKMGILVKGSNHLETLSQVGTVVFDKTGTLTKGHFNVTRIMPVGMAEGELLDWAAHAECHLSHPISQSILREYGKPTDAARVASVEEIPGYGVRAVVDGREVLAGNARLMERYGYLCTAYDGAGTVVHAAVDGVYAGYLLIEDEIKQDAKRAIEELRAAGIRQVVMLTGDADIAGQSVAAQLGLDRAYTELLPVDKVERVEQMMENPIGKLAFVGDGINDAPVLARSDIGVAMGGLGSDAAIEAADVVIMTDEPSKLAAGMRISKKTMRIVRQNITFALGVKGLVLLLGMFGIASMWAAVFADVGVLFLAILNAMRALRAPK